MRHPGLEVRINERLTSRIHGDRFELSLRDDDWEYCTGMDVSAATTLRDQLTAWIDEEITDQTVRSVLDVPRGEDRP
jgi:hypothetical protein